MFNLLTDIFDCCWSSHNEFMISQATPGMTIEETNSTKPITAPVIDRSAKYHGILFSKTPVDTIAGTGIKRDKVSTK